MKIKIRKINDVASKEEVRKDMKKRKIKVGNINKNKKIRLDNVI
jgi:hypothetical protein